MGQSPQNSRRPQSWQKSSRQFGPGSFAWMSRTSIPRLTMSAKTSRNGTMSRPLAATYMSLMSAVAIHNHSLTSGTIPQMTDSYMERLERKEGMTEIVSKKAA